MPKKPRKPLIEGLTVERAAAIALHATFKMAEDHGLCPLCVMDCAIQMMDDAEMRGVIHHLGSDEPEDFPTVGGVQ